MNTILATSQPGTLTATRSASGKHRAIAGVIPYSAWSDTIRDGSGETFRERIAPRAFRDSIQRGDVVAFRFNHREHLGTSKDLMRLHEGDDALRFHVTVPPDDERLGELHEEARSGRLSGVSFAMRVRHDEWSPSGELRTVHRADLKDISLLSEAPAYRACKYEARGLRQRIAEFFGASPVETRVAHFLRVEQDLEDTLRLDSHIAAGVARQIRERALFEARSHLPHHRLAEFKDALQQIGAQ